MRATAADTAASWTEPTGTGGLEHVGHGLLVITCKMINRPEIGDGVVYLSPARAKLKLSQNGLMRYFGPCIVMGTRKRLAQNNGEFPGQEPSVPSTERLPFGRRYCSVSAAVLH